MAAKIKKEFENGTPFIGLRTRRDDTEFKNRTVAGIRRKWRRVGRPDVGVWFLSFIMMTIGCHGYQEQRFAMEPQDQSAIVGSRVTLPCRVENKAGALQWTKDDFGLGTHRNLSGYERYSMVGSDEEGDYSLDIKDVTLDDDGRYQCQVSSGLNGEPGIRSRYAQLTVLVAPDPPRILQGAFIDATEGQPVDIECVSVGGKPAAEITWLDGNQQVIKKNVQSRVELLPDEQRFKTRSVLRLTPSKLHHNQTITCQAQNTADRAHRMATVHFEVKYVPKVNVTLKSVAINDMIPEGTEVRIHCDVDANPAPLLYRWYLNDNPVIGDYTDEMIIFNISRKHHKAEVRCEVSNSVGKGQEKITLIVTYPPAFRSRLQNVEANENSDVTLFCDVDGQPKPQLRWLFHEPGRIGQVKGQDAKLKVKVNRETAGRYICKATVKGYPEIESEATVFMKDVPKILSNRTQFGSEGEAVRIECAALSVPKAVDVTWYFENREISLIDPDFAKLDETLSDGVVKHYLVIRASQSKHYGMYNCSVANEFGSANAAIILKPIKTLPLFIILVGVTSGIIIFSAFIILLVICHRRRRKKSQQMSEKPDVTVTTSDMYKESDRSSNISDLKLQLPQSDGSYELEYTSSDRSDSKMAAGGLPLAGPVTLPNMRHDELMQFRYSNDYSDPTYSDPYYKNPAGYVYDYPQGYAPPPNLRVQSPTQLEVPQANRSLQGSLTRSIDTASTLPMSAGNGSQNNSLQRTNKSEETDAINNLGLPLGGDGPPTPIYAQPNNKHNPGVDLRYAATYGNPYLRNSSLGYGSQVHTAKPAATPAPPPYSAVRSSVVLPSGNGNQPSQATHV